MIPWYPEKEEPVSYNSLVFLKGACKGLSFNDTLHVINAAEILHAGQVRKGSGEPYVNHPTMVTCQLFALGVREEPILSVGMGHDILEDCETDADELRGRFGVEPATVERLRLMVHHPGQGWDEYMTPMYEDVALALPKISDRCNNVSTMGGAFTTAKIRSYIEETETYIIPLCKHAKRYWPQYSDAVFAMKYQILALTDTLTAVLDAQESSRALTAD